MAPRPTWKGYLKLSLVSCAVAMYTATSTSSRIRLNIINRETGNRIRNQAVDSETGDVVENENKVKGYEIDDGRYVLLEDEELDEVALESTHTIEIESFVPRSEVDEIYLDESFYIVPNDEVAYEAFAVIREAMKKKDMVGLGRVVMHRRERLLMLQPRGKGITATALRYKPEVRKEDAYFDEIPATKVPHDMLQLAEHILEQKKGHFDPSKFEDRYEDALTALIKAGRARRQGYVYFARPDIVVDVVDVATGNTVSSGVLLRSCFPDDAVSYRIARSGLASELMITVGGGAAPLQQIKRAAQQAEVA